MPVALISTSTSPAFGPSRSTVSIESGFPASHATAALVCMSSSFFKNNCHSRECGNPDCRAGRTVRTSVLQSKTQDHRRCFSFTGKHLVSRFRGNDNCIVRIYTSSAAYKAFLDEFTARFHQLAHQFGEEIVGLVGVLDLHQ